MLRSRLAAAAVAAVFGSVAGCCSLHSLFNNHKDCCVPESGCCEGTLTGSPVCDEGTPVMMPPGAQGTYSGPPPTSNVLPLAPAPRLVPQPQAQAIPYRPQ